MITISKALFIILCILAGLFVLLLLGVLFSIFSEIMAEKEKK